MTTELKPRWDMDVMIRRHCKSCGHEWVQPAETGRCPKCHRDRVENSDTRINVLKRV